MQQFKVGDRVKWGGNWPSKEYLIDEIIEDRALVSWGSEEDSYCTTVALSELTLIIEPQTVYAVCDDDEGSQPIRVFMFEDNAIEYARLNLTTPYSIRPFHLKPVNE